MKNPHSKVVEKERGKLGNNHSTKPRRQAKRNPRWGKSIWKLKNNGLSRAGGIA